MHFLYLCIHQRCDTPLHCAQLLLWAPSLEWEDTNNQPRQLWVHSPLRETHEQGIGSIQVHELKGNIIKELICQKYSAGS